MSAVLSPIANERRARDPPGSPGRNPISKKRTPRSREQVIHSALTKIVIDSESDCWIWQGGRSTQYAYATTWCEGTAIGVHRLLYEAKHGPLPKIAEDGSRVELHHDREAGCKGRGAGCVNPSHLAVMSARRHSQISAMERQLGLQEPRPPRRPRKKPSQSVTVEAVAVPELSLA